MLVLLLLALTVGCCSALSSVAYTDGPFSRRRLDLSLFPLASRSAYASEGAVKPFVGSVENNEQLKAALDSCSYKNEIIIISSTEHIGSIDAVAQTLWMLGRFGIAHVILVTPNEAGCAANHKNLPGACCVWASPDLPTDNIIAREAFSNHRRLTHYRLRIGARILRHSYNLFFLDTDVIIFDDPYKYFKAEPLASKNFMFDGHAMEANIGVMYIQNVAPNGPTAWIFAEAADRQLRWAENPTFLHSKKFPQLWNFQHLTWDQAIFGDALLSTVVGRPLFQGSFVFQDGQQFNHTWFELHSRMVRTFMMSEQVDRPPEQHRLFGGTSVAPLHWFKIRRPFSNATWPDFLGGPGFPPERGNFSRAFQAELELANVPLWPNSDQKVPDDCKDRGEQAFEWLNTKHPSRKLGGEHGHERYNEDEHNHENENEHGQHGLQHGHQLQVQDQENKIKNEHKQLQQQQQQQQHGQHEHGQYGQQQGQQLQNGNRDGSSAWDWQPILERGTEDLEVLYQEIAQERRRRRASADVEESSTAVEASGTVNDKWMDGEEKTQGFSVPRTLGGTHMRSASASASGSQLGMRVLQTGQQRRRLEDGTGSKGPLTDSNLCGTEESVAPLERQISTLWSVRRDFEDDWDYRTSDIAQIVGHILFLPLEKRIYKNALKMTYGWYNWDVGIKAKQGLVYFSSTPEVHVPLVLAPTTELKEAIENMSLLQLLETLRALFTAATASGRALAFPSLPCAHLERVIHEIKQHKELKRSKDGNYNTGMVPFTIDEKRGMCMWNDFMHGSCLDNGRGLLPPEFYHLLSTLPKGVAEAGPANTLHRPDASQLTHRSMRATGLNSDLNRSPSSERGGHGRSLHEDPLHPSAHISAEEMRSLTVEWSIQAFLDSAVNAPGMAVLPVLYMDHIPNITDFSTNEELAAKANPALNQCRGLYMY